MYRKIELKDLLVYSDIYGLGLTQADVDHLTIVGAAYSGKINAQYVYKQTSKNFDLALDIDVYAPNGAGITLTERHPISIQHGYPLLRTGNLFLRELPDANSADAVNTIQSMLRGADIYIEKLDDLRTLVSKNVIINSKIDVDRAAAYYWSAGQKFNESLFTKAMEKAEYSDMPPYVMPIIAVLQMADDTRLAFVIKKHQYNSWGTSYFDVMLMTYITVPGEPMYNYTDTGKYCSHIDTATGKPRIIYTEDTSFPKESEFIDQHRRGKGFITVDHAELDMVTRRWRRKQQDLAAEQDAIKKLTQKLETKIKNLKTTDFSYNDMDFKENSITYEHQSVESKSVSLTAVLTGYVGRYSEDYLNFENILSDWIKLYIYNAIKAGKALSAKIGDVDIKLEAKEVTSTNKTTGRLNKSTLFYVNGFRINKEEVEDVINRSLCFTETAMFEEFCESVAACSIKYHRLINSGIVVKVHDEIFDEQIEFKIGLDRVKKRNYITLEKKRWKVANTNRLLAILNANRMSRVISILLDEEIVGMKANEIKDILEKGKTALIEQRNRDEEFLQATIQQFGIEKVDNYTCNNGKVLSGYVVHGKLRDYVVEETKCMVFEYPTGRYICMVDRGNNEHTNTSRIVNRFYALSNDSKLAKEISTL